MGRAAPDLFVASAKHEPTVFHVVTYRPSATAEGGPQSYPFVLEYDPYKSLR